MIFSINNFSYKDKQCIKFKDKKQMRVTTKKCYNDGLFPYIFILLDDGQYPPPIKTTEVANYGTSDD